MKNKRNVIVAFLLVAALCLGIGYAAITDDLYVAGTLNAQSNDFTDDVNDDIYFTTAAISTTSTADSTNNKATAVIGADKNEHANDQLTITVSDSAFTAQDQTLVVTVKVHNANTAQTASVAFGTPAVSSDCFSVTVTTDNNSTTVPAGGDLDCTITITLVKIPTVDIDDATITIGCTATVA